MHSLNSLDRQGRGCYRWSSIQTQAATFEHGVLRLALPKADSMKPKQIKVKTTPVIEGKAS